MDRRQLIATVEIAPDDNTAAGTQRLKVLASEPDFRQWLKELAEQIQPNGIAPSGFRLVSTRDMAKWLGGTASWHERHRQRFVDAGLLIRASGNRRYIGDLRKIQEAIGNPEFWADDK